VRETRHCRGGGSGGIPADTILKLASAQIRKGMQRGKAALPGVWECPHFSYLPPKSGGPRGLKSNYARRQPPAASHCPNGWRTASTTTMTPLEVQEKLLPGVEASTVPNLSPRSVQRGEATLPGV